MAKTEEKQPEAAQQQEDLAEVVRRIGSGMEALLRSGLNKRAIVTLIAADTRVRRTDIESVLNSLGTLAKTYTTAKT